MNWLEEFCEKYNVTLYELSKNVDIPKSYLYKIVKENISFMDIKVSYYMAIVDFFKDRASSPSCILPVDEFSQFSKEMSEYRSIYESWCDGSLPMQDYLERSSVILARLNSTYSHFTKDGMKFYICKEKSYLDAIK